jgi:hypothetical protein
MGTELNSTKLLNIGWSAAPSSRRIKVASFFCGAVLSASLLLCLLWATKLSPRTTDTLFLGPSLACSQSESDQRRQHDSCPVPCDVLQLANLTRLEDAPKINCNIEFLTVGDLGRFLAAHKRQPWVHFVGDSLLRLQFGVIVGELAGTLPESGNPTSPIAGICCPSEGLNGNDSCRTWTFADENWEVSEGPERVRKELALGDVDFCITYSALQFHRNAMTQLEALFPGDEVSVQPMAVVYNMGLHPIYMGHSQLAFRKDLENLTERLRAIRTRQKGEQVSENRVPTRFLYHTITAYSEEVFGFIDPLRRNERTDLFVRIQETHFERNPGVYHVVDANRLTRYLDWRHVWARLKMVDGIHPAKPFYEILSLLDYNYILRGLVSFCTKPDDLEYQEMEVANYSDEQKPIIEALRRVHGWGA